MKKILALCFLASALASNASTYKTLMVDADTRVCAQPVNLTNARIAGTPGDALATDTELAAHTSRTDNPHAVSKAQLGLGNVDNTSDLAKPVSTATQAALDLKADADTLDADKIVTGTVNAARLPASGATAGTYGSSTAIPVVTVDAKGRVTAATTAAVKGGHVVQADGAAMAARDNLDFGAGLGVTDDPANNATKVSLPTTAYSMTFDSSDLVDSVLTVNHNLGDAGALSVALKDADGKMHGFPSGVTYTDSMSLEIDFTGAAVSGIWTVGVIKAGGIGGGVPSWEHIAGDPMDNSALAASLNNLDAGKLTTGTLAAARLPASGATAGSYTNASVTVNAKGIVTAASSGAGGGMWTLVERWEPSAAASSHTFSGLNGDSDRRYLLVCNVVANGATGQYFARLNNDSGSNYSSRAFDGYGDSTFENNRQTWTGICIGYTGDATYTADSVQVWAKPGRARFCQVDSLRVTSSLAQEIGRFGVVWTNTADNITYLSVSAPSGGNFGVGSCVELWKLAQ